MDESWREVSDDLEPQLRIKWARVHRTEFTRPTDAAQSLQIRPGTYRTYEVPKSEGGRRPDLSTIQSIARKYKVSWLWLATGSGSPDDVMQHPVGAALLAKFQAIPAEKQDDAAAAAIAVLEAFAARKSA